MKKQELKRKVDDLKHKISTIENYGGLVKDQMKQEFVSLENEYSSFVEGQNPIELKFKEEYLKHHAYIQQELEKVYERMNNIIKYSEEHGVAFTSKVRIFYDTYSPNSVSLILSDFDYDFINLLSKETNCHAINYGGGWVHSMRSCY